MVLRYGHVLNTRLAALNSAESNLVDFTALQNFSLPLCPHLQSSIATLIVLVKAEISGDVLLDEIGLDRELCSTRRR